MPNSTKKLAAKRPVHLRFREDIYAQAQVLANSKRTPDWPDGMPLATYLQLVIEPLIIEKFKELEDSQGD